MGVFMGVKHRVVSLSCFVKLAKASFGRTNTQPATADVVMKQIKRMLRSIQSSDYEELEGG